MPPSYALERLLSAGGSTPVAGIDEVGRGAWAGPVAVCAVVTDLSEPPAGLTDSKLLTPARREALVPEITAWAAGIGYGEASHEEIDELGMTEALRRAARRALAELPVRPGAVILDGKHDYLGAPWPVRCEIKADQSCVSVAAASVIAKVRRDAYMASLGFEEYGFASNAGYPSPVHRRALAEHGPTEHHRLSWSYLDKLPRWSHLRRHRDATAGAGQLGLFG
ncbi:ribonuclease HII [Planobispora rosea]|uniref:ribonuclease HII n=1 Tax=Planobispora rosea TaxID=35762 RepID=UPI00083A11CF|nr:ribonuclease HII [Planobispora rosea]